MKRIFTLAAFVLLTHLSFSQTWIKKADFIGPGRSRCASFSIGDTCYVIGGGSNTMGYLRSCYAYDTTTNVWWSIPDYPGLGSDGLVGFALNGKGYAGTGAVGGYQYYNDFWKYDPATNAWTSIPSFPGQGRSFDVSFIIGGKGYVGGGVNGFNNNPLPDFFAYDPIANQWDSVATCPASGVVQSSAFSIGNKGYFGTGFVLSGGGYTYTPDKEFWEYDPSVGHLGTWTRKADFPGVARGLAAGVGNSTKGYMGLGYSNIAGSPHYKDFYEFDPSDNTWTCLPDFLGSNRCAAATFVVGDNLFIGIGADYSTNANQLDFYEYIPGGAGGSTVSASANPPTICGGQSSTLTALGGTSYSWSPSTGLTDTTSASVSAAPTITTTYVLTATGICTAGTDTVVVVVGASGSLTVSNDTSVCSGMHVQLLAYGSGTFSWSPGLTLTTDSTISNPIADPTTTTTYTVSGDACTTPAEVVITIANSAFGGNVTAVRDTICQNTPGNLTLSNNSGNGIQWQSSTDDLNFTDALNDTLINYKTLPLTQTTWYRATVGTGNCSAISDTLKLFVPPALTATFNYTQATANQLSFNADSSVGSINSYHWDFGDGNVSSEKNPTHTYTRDSTYYVCLTLYDGSNCSYTFCRYSSVTDAVLSISAEGNWVIYPNPFGEQLIVSSKQVNSHMQNVEMYDVLGQLVLNKSAGNAISNSLQLDVSLLTKGMYYVMIRTADADYVQKVVKQ